MAKYKIALMPGDDPLVGTGDQPARVEVGAGESNHPQLAAFAPGRIQHQIDQQEGSTIRWPHPTDADRLYLTQRHFARRPLHVDRQGSVVNVERYGGHDLQGVLHFDH